ncbi:MAG: hypothetical protein GC202_10210 [Alphaproteobacteria bacterium]|nr:hypothetical protein [Alphaproteobacteria bacterium]
MAELYPLPQVISPISARGGAPSRVERDVQRTQPPPPPAQAAPVAATDASYTTPTRGNNVNIEA